MKLRRTLMRPHFHVGLNDESGEPYPFGWVWAGWWLITWERGNAWRSLSVTFNPD